MTSKPEPVADERLTGAHDLALSALHEITAPDTVGPPAGYTTEDDGAVSLRFHTRLSGYPGWFWTVSVAVVDEAEPTVLEVELLPGDGALLAPDWVPWATRLAEYQAAQEAAAHADDELDEDEDESDDDESDDDDVDDDEPKPRFHAGDLDGVDIDELDADHAVDHDADDDDDDAADDEDIDEGERSY
ncbi:DUF3027 domain-containing protein [uncultured Microbacterium sp.]|uniref:DUF3027 domain-containing protein n=1 Tax=uncultured Microbacterium sp. TaxID=191216 RepID=UPI0025F5C604|nr:DUF3027 domain-containing protein [uncultured Microbacterium sp.]